MEVFGQPVDQFDVSSASTIFWDKVPVLLQRADKEDAVEQLCIRLLSGNTRQSANLKVLRMHIFNDRDLLFLHTLEVSEDDFQTLKAEQGILVDFANFSGKIIDLLKRCIASREQETPRFKAVLTMTAGESVFKMVETNDFKQLPHISLCFRPGTDNAIKSFLAFRLTEVQQQCSSLTIEVSTCQAQIGSLEQELSQQQQEAQNMATEHAKWQRESEAKAKDAASAALQERMQERDELINKFERTKQTAQQQHETETRGLQARVAELDQENRELRDNKYALESRSSELMHKLESREGQVSSLTQESVRLQQQFHETSRDKMNLDVALADARTKLAACQEKASMHEKMLQQQDIRTQDLEQSLKQAEARCTELRDAGASHEHRAREAASEVTKSSQVIERLTSDLQTSKDKLRRKQVIIVRQEEELQAREKKQEAVHSQLQEAQGAARLAQEERAQLRTQEEALQAKLLDSKEQLKGNEQMIRWLNSQVNEAHVAAARPSGTSSRFAFRPSLALQTADGLSSNGTGTVGSATTAANASNSMSFARGLPMDCAPEAAAHHGRYGSSQHTPVPFQPLSTNVALGTAAAGTATAAHAPLKSDAGWSGAIAGKHSTFTPSKLGL